MINKSIFILNHDSLSRHGKGMEEILVPFLLNQGWRMRNFSWAKNVKMPRMKLYLAKLVVIMPQSN
jgi:hypothetical protein